MDPLDERIKRIHSKTIIVDSHLDLGMDVFDKRCHGETKIIENEYLNEIKRGGINVIVAAIFLKDRQSEIAPTRIALEQISSLYAEINESPDVLCICRTYNEIMSAVEQKKIALVLAIEGAEPIGRNPELLYSFYELGVRVFGISWSRRNYLADGALYTTPSNIKETGLTEIGKKAVEIAISLGMIIDVSHLNDYGIDDIIKIGVAPIIASHSNCRFLNPTKRNLCDDHIKLIASTGGVICMNSISAIISSFAGGATMDMFIKHFNHVRDLVGIKHMGIGLDLTNRIISRNDKIIVNNKAQPIFSIVESYDKLEILTDALISSGYSDEEIKAIYGNNMLRVFKETMSI